MGIPSGLRKSLKIFGWVIRTLFRWKWIQNLAKRYVDKYVEGPTRKMREEGTSQLWCKISNEKGQYKEAWLKTIEAYNLTAIAGIKAVEQTLNRGVSGAKSPAEAFGWEFVLEIPNTHILDKKKRPR